MGGSASRCEDPRSTGNPNNRKSILTDRKPPHNYEAIMKDADIDSSEEKTYDLICSEVFLNQRRKMYWVEKNSGHNCFMLYARDLIIDWGHEKRYWKWSYIEETKSKVLVEVGELVSVWWLKVKGRFDTSNLSPGIMYEVLFVVMLKVDASGWDGPVDIRLELPDGITKERKELLQNKPRGKWVEIQIGEFLTSSPNNMGEMQVFMYENGQWKRGLAIKGVIIRPKI